MRCYRGLNEIENIFPLLGQTKEKYTYLVARKLGFQKVPVGRITGWPISEL